MIAIVSLTVAALALAGTVAALLYVLRADREMKQLAGVARSSAVRAEAAAKKAWDAAERSRASAERAEAARGTAQASYDSTVHLGTTGMTTADAARALERQRARREAMQHRRFSA